MFSCKKCKSDLNDSYRYCYGCGSYIGEPPKRSEEDELLNENNEEQTVRHGYSEDGKIVKLHCANCSEIVEQHHKYCTSCGESLENNLRAEIIESVIEEESSTAIKAEDSVEEKLKDYRPGISDIFKAKLINKRYITAAVAVLILAIAWVYIGKTFFKPTVVYEYDSGSGLFARNKDWVFYSYSQDVNEKEVQSKNGIYKIKADGNEKVKISNNATNCMSIYKNYLYYINTSDFKIYRMKTDGSDNKKVSEETAVNFVISDGYIYFRKNFIFENKYDTLYRMKLNGSNVKEVAKDVLTYNIIGNKIYYSSISHFGDVYSIKTDGTDKKIVCKIDGVLQYIKDEYIYYVESKTNTKDIRVFASNNGNLYKAKLDGSNITKISDDLVNKFGIDEYNNIYYLEAGSGYKVYKINGEGKKKTLICENTSPLFYATNSKVYYISDQDHMPYRKDFKSNASMKLIDVEDKAAENVSGSVLATDDVFLIDEAENLKSNIVKGYVNVITNIDNKGGITGTEVYNMNQLNKFIDSSNAGKHDLIRIIEYSNIDSRLAVKKIVNIEYVRNRIEYTTYLRVNDMNRFMPYECTLFESMQVTQDNNSIRYSLKEHKYDPDEKSMTVISFENKSIKN